LFLEWSDFIPALAGLDKALLDSTACNRQAHGMVLKRASIKASPRSIRRRAIGLADYIPPFSGVFFGIVLSSSFWLFPFLWWWKETASAIWPLSCAPALSSFRPDIAAKMQKKIGQWLLGRIYLCLSFSSYICRTANFGRSNTPCSWRCSLAVEVFPMVGPLLGGSGG